VVVNGHIDTPGGKLLNGAAQITVQIERLAALSGVTKALAPSREG
jgi:hypothetical protein